MVVRLSTLLAGLRDAFTRETLPPPPTRSTTPPARPGALRLLFGRETLPLDPPSPPRPGRAGPWRLLAPERLAEEPPRAPHRRTRWLAWLFLPERLDGGDTDPR